MNDLCADIGYRSINHAGEQLCGDHVDVVEQGENSMVIVLADGLGSGVKASILSTLTSKIISTMMANDLPLEDCVQAIAKTLPICKVRGVAYSTFTILRIVDCAEAELIQYDNPHTILLRRGKHVDYPEICENIDGKNIYKSRMRLWEGDVLVAMSDGALNASQGNTLNMGWDRAAIIDFLETMYNDSFTAKSWAAMLVEECERLYGGQPGDDTSACVIRLRRRQVVNLLFGPPEKREDTNKMLSLFFAKEGKRIVCGGTSATIVSRVLKKKLDVSMDYVDPEIPPIAYMDGIELVTEGVLTLNRVVQLLRRYAKNETVSEDFFLELDKQNGASMVAKMLIEDCTELHLYVGKAINSAYQNPGLPFDLGIRQNLVEQLKTVVEEMGKQVTVTYY